MSSWSSEVVVGSGDADMVGCEIAPGTSRSIACYWIVDIDGRGLEIFLVQKFGVDGNHQGDGELSEAEENFA